MFSGMLQQILDRTEGAEMALLVGNDGIVIDRAGQTEDTEFESLAAEFAVVMNRSRATAADTGLGTLSELMTVTDQAILLTKIVNEDFFVMMKLGIDCTVGRARYEARRMEYMVEQILES